MKKLTHDALKAVIVVAFLVTAFCGCKKKENVIPLVNISQKTIKDNNVSERADQLSKKDFK